MDIAWSDFAFGLTAICRPMRRTSLQRQAEETWSAQGDALACLSVRSGFDLLLAALDLPRGSEVAMSALTISDMPRIVANRGLVPVPIDVDVERLSPTVESLRQAITPRTKAVVVAHLCGGRAALAPVVDLAREHRLLLIEDCAQAYAGPRYQGRLDADVSMFSFGSIKSATALGGAVLCVRNAALRERMRSLQADYSVQGRLAYARRLLKYLGLKSLSSGPVYSALVRACDTAGCDYDRLINGAVKGFAGADLFRRIRLQPSAPLLAMLVRRWRRFDAARLADREQKGARLARLIEEAVVCPGVQARPHSHWVFPVLAEDPAPLVAALKRAGFDATQGQSMCVVQPPADRPQRAAAVAQQILAKTVYLPCYPEMPDREITRLAGVVVRECRWFQPAVAHPVCQPVPIV